MVLGCHALVSLMIKLKVANLFVVDLVSICTSSVTYVYLGHLFSFLTLLIWSPYALPVSHLFTYVVYSPFPIWANPTFIPPSLSLSVSFVSEFERVHGSAWEPKLWWRAHKKHSRIWFLHLVAIVRSGESTMVEAYPRVDTSTDDKNQRGMSLALFMHLIQLSRDYVIYKYLLRSNAAM